MFQSLNTYKFLYFRRVPVIPTQELIVTRPLAVNIIIMFITTNPSMMAGYFIRNQAANMPPYDPPKAITGLVLDGDVPIVSLTPKS